MNVGSYRTTRPVCVVVTVLPSLIPVSRSPIYRFFRVGSALIAGAAPGAWLLERLFDIQTPVDAVMNAVAQLGMLTAITGFFVSLVCRLRYGVAATNRAIRPRKKGVKDGARLV